MTMNWSAKLVKYLLFVFNLIFAISGIIILSAGVTVKALYYNYRPVLDSSYFSPPNLLIAIGAIIFIIAFFGCCGAVKENYCMVITFSTLLILIFVLEMAAGISGYVLKDETSEYLTNTLYASMKEYKPNSTFEMTVIWDEIQRDFHCCGVKNYSDWLDIKMAPTVSSGLPISCCEIPNGIIGTFECSNSTASLHKTGCVKAFGDFLREHAGFIGSIGLGFAAVQFIGIIFSCHLSRKIKMNYETM